MNRIINYVRATGAELKQVNWPTQNQAMLYTALVIAISIIVSLFVGAFDYAFLQLMTALIERV